MTLSEYKTGEYQTGDLLELHSDYPDAGRTVDYQFVDGVSGELTLLTGEPLLEGESYLLTDGKQNKRVEILKATVRHIPDAEPRTEYSFRIV